MKSLLCIFALFAATLMSHAATSLQQIQLKDIDGKPVTLASYAGKTVLLVNVASKCGYTPQYKGLEALQQKYKDKGFTVIGVPCNDFGAQEPGSAKEIKEFCSSTYNVSFPLLEKAHVKGAEQHPLYAALTGPGSQFPGDIKWNFGKFLISPEGKVIKRYDSKDTPESLEKDIEAALPKK
jgi:glutathione peroxidase